jgi:UDP-galactose transporter B1
MISTLTAYGIVLEFVTSGGRKLHEISFIFVTTSIYSITALVARHIFNEKTTDISKYQMLVLSLTSLSSTFTSVRSLRYVIYPVQVLFKSCKPVPVMIFGTVLGKKYPLRKYVNVIIITTGVALFMGGGTSQTDGGASNTTWIGGFMLSISLCFDGLTGAYEDKLMGNDHVEPFDLMFNIQLGKAVISFVILMTTNGIGDFYDTIIHGGWMLFILGLTGAMGQVFVFVTISKFGALNCALIGLFRKILSLLLSFILYNHTLNVFQIVGLTLALAAMIANFYEKGGKKKEIKQVETGDEENLPLLVVNDNINEKIPELCTDEIVNVVNVNNDIKTNENIDLLDISSIELAETDKKTSNNNVDLINNL